MPLPRWEAMLKLGICWAVLAPGLPPPQPRGSRIPSLGRLPFDFPPPLHIEMVQAPRALAPRDSQPGARRAGPPAVLTPSDGAEPPEWGGGDCRRP